MRCFSVQGREKCCERSGRGASLRVSDHQNPHGLALPRLHLAVRCAPPLLHKSVRVLAHSTAQDRLPGKQSKECYGSGISFESAFYLPAEIGECLFTSLHLLLSELMFLGRSTLGAFDASCAIMCSFDMFSWQRSFNGLPRYKDDSLCPLIR